jgi:hypothetical protein
MPALLSAVVVVACVLASARRLAFAVLPVWLDTRLVAVALQERGVAGLERLRQLVAGCDQATWERDLFAAAAAADVPSRHALVNEQLGELDWRVQRWARVPRVCASIATSAGFLFGSLALIQGLNESAEEIAPAVVSAVDALAVGVAGTSFCVAVHLRARQAVRERLAATDRLVDCLGGLLT